MDVSSFPFIFNGRIYVAIILMRRGVYECGVRNEVNDWEREQDGGVTLGIEDRVREGESVLLP